MQEFDHPNVLTLRGVCLDGGPTPYIIMPFMNNGSLLSHLKEERKTLVIEPRPRSRDLDVTVSCFKLIIGVGILALVERLVLLRLRFGRLALLIS